jgi:hypothetical protein
VVAEPSLAKRSKITVPSRIVFGRIAPEDYRPVITRQVRSSAGEVAVQKVSGAPNA